MSGTITKLYGAERHRANPSPVDGQHIPSVHGVRGPVHRKYGVRCPVYGDVDGGRCPVSVTPCAVDGER